MNRTLGQITNELAGIKGVKAVILYGSFARNEHTSRSDVDLFILVSDKTVIKSVQDKIIELENKTGMIVQPTIRTLKELKETDSGLLQNIFQEGKILYLKSSTKIPSTMLLEQKPHIVYSFQLNNLGQNKKAQFNNIFYGRKKDKYEYAGFLNKLGGRKLASGCVIVSYIEKLKIEKFFKKYNVKFNQLKVWK